MSVVIGRNKMLLSATLAGVLAIGTIYFSIPDIKWRVNVLALKLTGQIDGITMSELIHMISPGSGFWLEPVVETRNPYAAIENPFSTTRHIAEGRTIFEDECAICHGSEGVGSSAPSLSRPTLTHGDSDWSIYKTVRDGLDGTAMPQARLRREQIWTVIAYLRTLQNTASGIPNENSINVPAVSSNMLLNSDEDADNWLMYSGQYNGQRFSSLSEINDKNASQVVVGWIHQFDGQESIHETSPIVVDGTMFVTEAPNTIHALDAADGALLWTYTYRNPPDVITCCGRVNRGVAIYDRRIYMGTLDSHLVVVNAEDGKLISNTELHDYRLGSSITGAPLIVDKKALIGYGGGDFGLRGFLDAVNVNDGTRDWRLYTIPAEGEPGNESWSGDSWKTGGAPTWLTGSYDNSNGTIYWPTGNPGPDYQGDLRLGDNLYSSSILALDSKSGTLKWHFQFTPHDEHDWDANQIPILVDRQFQGQNRRLLITANRNGFFYVLDRDTGEFLLAKEFVYQNWATEIDANGRPVLNADAILSTKGTITWPSPIGATNWQSPTYSPDTGLFYVPALEYGQIVFKNVGEAEYQPDKPFLGGYHRNIPGDETLFFSVRALDVETGTLVWEYNNPSRPAWWKTGGLVSTKGNVLFGGDNTEVFFLNALTGEELWRRNIGGRINAAPITYAVNGKQYFAIAAGRSIVTLTLQSNE